MKQFIHILLFLALPFHKDCASFEVQNVLLQSKSDSDPTAPNNLETTTGVNRQLFIPIWDEAG